MRLLNRWCNRHEGKVLLLLVVVVSLMGVAAL
jgi:hypothetical protein